MLAINVIIMTLTYLIFCQSCFYFYLQFLSLLFIVVSIDLRKSFLFISNCCHCNCKVSIIVEVFQHSFYICLLYVLYLSSGIEVMCPIRFIGLSFCSFLKHCPFLSKSTLFSGLLCDTIIQLVLRNA